jgi:hypothetical protein
MLPALPLALALLGAPPLPSACSVLTKAEAQTYLGQPVVRAVPEAPAPDPEAGSIHTSCTFMGQGRALVISIDEFPTAAAAQQKMTAEHLKSQGDEDEEAPAKIEPESGLGDRAFFGQSAHAAMVLMLKGTHAYGAILGGSAPAPTDRAALRKLVLAVAGRVP